MAARTTRKSIIFSNPFPLAGLDETLPPGTYEVETDEELLEGLSFQAYRRVLTVIHLPPSSGNPLLTRAFTIDPDDLEAAILRDQKSSASKEGDPSTADRSDSASQACAEKIAIEAAENEGMVRPLDRPG